jgi:PAS domain S-box-containing protein
VINEPRDQQLGRTAPSGNGDHVVGQTPQNVAEVLESISDAFFALDRQWRFTYLNSAAERLVLRRREELLGKNIWEEFPQAVGSTFDREYRRAVTEKVTVQFEELYPPLETWFSVRAYPTPTGLAIYFQDVNERRRRNEELKQAKERFRAAAAAVEGLIYDADLTTRTVVRSEGLFALVGYHPEEADETGAWWEERIHPEDWAECLGPASRALASPSQGQFEVEYRVRHRDGHYVSVWDRALIFRDGEGRPVRLVGSTFDITARRRTEAALRESEERHRIISELTSDYNYTVRINADGTSSLELVTEGFTRITGYTLEEVNARGGWAILIHPEDTETAYQGHERVLSGQANASVLRLITREGGIRWVRNLSKPVWDGAQGCVIRIVGAAQDITERMEAEEQLHESRERLQALSRQLLTAQENERRRLAHELHDEVGQTLTAISVNLQAARAVGGKAARPHLGEAIAIVDQAIEQVRHLSLDLRPSMLDDLGLEAALRWYADRQIRRTGLAIHLDTNVGSCRLPAEMETACFRVAQEALTNVVRHARARRAWIELQQRGEALELAVRDDGIGFDPKAARKRAAEGASFGLLGMQERVELLGGELAIESRPGQGTSVRARFVVPALPPAQEAPREAGKEITNHETDPGLAGR